MQLTADLVNSPVQFVKRMGSFQRLGDRNNFQDELDNGNSGGYDGLRADPNSRYKMAPREYGTALAMQRTTMAYVRTAVSIAGLGRSSSSARLQYFCDFASIFTLCVGVAQHFTYGNSMFKVETLEREETLMRTLFSSAYFFHNALLFGALLVGAVAALAAYTNLDQLPGPIPFFLTAQ